MPTKCGTWNVTSECTEVRFASLLSGGFTMAVINPPERKLAKRTSVAVVAWFQKWLLFFGTLKAEVNLQGCRNFSSRLTRAQNISTN